MTNKEVEQTIRRAFEIDRALPFPRPSNAECLLGKMIIIPNTERSLEDMAEDTKYIITQEDFDVWHKVMFDWMPILNGMKWAVVKYRCSGMGWKRLARQLKDKKMTYRELDRTTLWRIFMSGLNEISLKG